MKVNQIHSMKTVRKPVVEHCIRIKFSKEQELFIYFFSHVLQGTPCPETHCQYPLPFSPGVLTENTKLQIQKYTQHHKEAQYS